jgi:cystathionine beta-lyase/cystathionine gamma-synthase
MKLTIELHVCPVNSATEAWEIQTALEDNTTHLESAVTLALCACGIPAHATVAYETVEQGDDYVRGWSAPKIAVA